MYDSNQCDSSRFAQMQSSIMNRGTFGSTPSKINLKNKFNSIEGEINSIQNQVRKLMVDTNESSNLTKQMNTDIAERNLNHEKNKLLEEVKKLERAVKYGIAESQLRSERIWTEAKNRLKVSQCLKNSMNNLRERITRLENTLGYHSVSDNVL